MAAAVALSVLTACAFISHPERRGNNSLPIAAVPLVVDLLLFIPGVVPGVIALVIDFGSGAIYLRRVGPSASVPGQPGPGKQQERVYVRVIDQRGNVLDERALTVVAPDAPGQTVTAELPDLRSPDWGDDTVHLEIATATSEPILVPAPAS